MITAAMTCCCLLASSAFAAAQLNAAGLEVRGTAEEIEVFSLAGTSGPEYFCAAGEYARHVLGIAANKRLVVTRTPGPSPTRSNRRSVSFAVEDAPRLGGLDTVFVRAGQRGASRSVGMSQLLCESL